MAEIVEVRFIKDTQSVHTGNEFYAAGTTAHFFDYQTDVLVEQGWAVLASEPPTGDPPFPPAPTSNYSRMTVKQLKALMLEYGLFTPGVRKADFIAALEENNG